MVRRGLRIQLVWTPAWAYCQQRATVVAVATEAAAVDRLGSAAVVGGRVQGGTEAEAAEASKTQS